MIISNKIEIKISPFNKKYYESKGYICNINDIIFVNVYDLSYGVSIKIKVKCDVCGNEKELSYCKYNKNIKNGGFYSCSSKCSSEKVKKTNIINFGHACVMNCDSIKERVKNTNLDKYGCENVFQNNEIKNKIKITNLEKYGYENSFQNNEIKNKSKKTKLKKYGDENYTNLEKNKETCLKKYGVEHILQNSEFHLKQQKSGYKLKIHDRTKLYYRGNYEKDFLDYCFDNNIKIEQGKRIKYYYENKDHYYFSDFYFKPKNLIIEIKSTWTYNKYLEKNLEKQKSTKNKGYDYLFIIDKNYKEFDNIIDHII